MLLVDGTTRGCCCVSHSLFVATCKSLSTSRHVQHEAAPHKINKSNKMAKQNNKILRGQICLCFTACRICARCVLRERTMCAKRQHRLNEQIAVTRDNRRELALRKIVYRFYLHRNSCFIVALNGSAKCRIKIS